MDDEARCLRTVLSGIVTICAAAIVMAACGAESAPTELVPTQAPLPTATMPPIPTLVPTALPPTATPVPSPTSVPPTPTATGTATPSPTPSPTASPEPTPTPALGPEIEAAATAGDCEFFLEVANSAEKRQVGLMGRESMGRDRGMLFVFSEERVLGFWMKNTLIPLDIIFVDSGLTVVDVQTMRPEHEIAPAPLPTYTSAAPALYAIEVNEGVAAECGIEPGDAVELRNLNPGVLK